MLVVFGGLPGSGKTTIAGRVAARTRSVLLRIDVVEHALREAFPLPEDLGDGGYAIAAELASSNLNLGLDVIADSVNPIETTRRRWRDVAERSGAALLEVEIVCSDEREHRRRVELRSGDIAGLRLPNWEAVLAREYEPWATAELVVDSSRLSPLVASTVRW